MQAVNSRHQRCGAVDHRSINHLPLAGTPRFEHRSQQTHREVSAAAAKIGDQIERNRRRTVLLSDHCKHARQCTVIGIMAGTVAQWTILAPARHASVNQALISGATVYRPKSKSLHDAGPKAFEQSIGLAAQREYECLAGVLFEIESISIAAAVHYIETWWNAEARFVALAHDAHNIGTHVGEQHAAELRRANARDLDNAKSGKRAHERDRTGMRYSELHT